MPDPRDAGAYRHPHIILPADPTVDGFRPRSGGRGRRPIAAIHDRRGHSEHLAAGLNQAVHDAGVARRHWVEQLRAEGVVLAVEGWPGGFELALESLDLRRSGIELLSLQKGSDEQAVEIATVFVPDDKIDHFFGRLDDFATRETLTGRPRHEALIANISNLRHATLRQLWTDNRPFPEEGVVWWELWLRRTGDENETLSRVAELLEWDLALRTVEFPDRTVAAARTDSQSLASALSSALPVAEVRLANLAQSVAELPPRAQRVLLHDLESRVRPPPLAAPCVCLLDTGIYQHSLLRGALGVGAVQHVVGSDGQDRHGHGTELAGLALYGDLTDPLTSGSTIQLAHGLESVKILPDPGAPPNRPDTYGAVTAAGVASPEATAPERDRVYCLANSDHGSQSDGRPSLWSATIDALAFGTDVVSSGAGIELLSDPDPDASRLILIAAGNVREGYRSNFLDVCDISPVEDPGQAWNALTVGAFTELEDPPGDPSFAGYGTLAPAGELSPFSRTSVTFSRIWPVKPDIVMEGGNLLVSPTGRAFDRHEVVGVATTSLMEPYGRPFSAADMTSAAVPQAARLAAIATARYPNLWPETLRGLLVHSAEWTDPMLSALDQARTKADRLRLVRRYGFGTPTVERVLRSASSAVTLVAQSHIQPYEPAGGRTRLREMHLHELPWPREQLLDLGETPVRMKVTLSYFVEPNPSNRGWRGRYVYPSHGLRFDIRRPGESVAQFRARLNKLAEDEESQGSRSDGAAPDWKLGPTARSVGSIHSDVWEGTAAELADSGVLGVYPVGGWWKNNNRRDRHNIPVRYGILVSLVTPEVTVDLYTPITSMIGVPIEIET